MTKHYVEFYYPGSFVSETSTEEIESRTANFEIPKYCFGFMFFDQEETLLDGETLYGNRKNKSNFFYFGKAYTLAEVKKTFPDARILISNMKGNGWDSVVKTRRGNFQPLEKEDVVLTFDTSAEELFYGIDMYEDYRT